MTLNRQIMNAKVHNQKGNSPRLFVKVLKNN